MTPVSRTASSLANGIVIELTPVGVEGSVVTLGVKPAIVVVVVVDVVVAASGTDVIGSTGITGEVVAGLTRAIVVVVTFCGEFTTLTDNAKSGSVINITTERSAKVFVILPIRPAAFKTGIPTRIPLFEP